MTRMQVVRRWTVGTTDLVGQRTARKQLGCVVRCNFVVGQAMLAANLIWQLSMKSLEQESSMAQ